MKKMIFPILMLFVGYASIMKAEDSDLSAINNVIYVKPTTANVGETTTLSICMKNTVPIRGFQFDLLLPDGITAVKGKKGRYNCALSEERLETDDEHTLTLAEQEDGCIRFLCGSQYDVNFIGNDGEIATIQVDIAGHLDPDNYPIILMNMKLTETDISRYYEADWIETTLTLIINESDGIKSVDTMTAYDGKTYDLQGRLVAQPSRGLYVKNGRKVFVK